MHFSFQVYSGKKSQGGERNHNRVKYFSKGNFYCHPHHIGYSSENKGRESQHFPMENEK